MSLVTVICLCYNQAHYVGDAVTSVFDQHYSNVELIVVNDASQDNSSEVILKLLEKYPSVKFVNHQENKGMCKSFNEALSLAEGDYIIDLAADDILLPERISEQVKVFQTLNQNYGVVFSDAYEVNEKKEIVGTFYLRNNLGQLLSFVPQGNVFKYLVHSYQICSPTIMVRKSVLDELGGYDENLSYEDYDFFIRSSRNYKYYFIDKPLIYKREVKGSVSKGFYNKNHNLHLHSTLIICKKALWLCRDKEERQALLHSVRYHFRQSYFLNNFTLAEKYFELIISMGSNSIVDRVILLLAKKQQSVYSLYLFYRKVRYAFK